MKTEDVMLQKAQKPLLKGIIAVTRIVDDFMKAEKGKKSLPSSESVMKILSDSISLLRTLSDGSHRFQRKKFVQRRHENNTDCFIVTKIQ